MQFLKKIINFYILSNLHVALAGLCLAKITLFKFEINEHLTPVFVGLSIIVSYNFIRFYELKTNKLSSLKGWFLTHVKILGALSFFSGIGLLYILFFLDFNRNALNVLFPFLLMTLFYVIPLFKIGNMEVSFRNFPGLKVFSIGVAWAGVTVLFPLYEARIEFTLSVYLEFIQRILILIAIIIPFDIRDVKSDSRKLKTLPQVLGVYGSKWLGLVLLILFVMLTFLDQKQLINEVSINVLISIVTGLFLWFSSPKKTRFYTSFWVEAIPVFWLGLILLFL